MSCCHPPANKHHPRLCFVSQRCNLLLQARCQRDEAEKKVGLKDGHGKEASLLLQQRVPQKQGARRSLKGPSSPLGLLCAGISTPKQTTSTSSLPSEPRHSALG